MKKYLKFTPLILVFLLGAILRLILLNHNPPSLNWDETSHAYNAYSLLKTGMDEWGTKFPLIFRAFGDYKLPGYIYATVPSVALFGLTPFAARLPSALAGVMALLGIFFLTRQLFQQLSPKALSFYSLFLLSFLPWHFFISRPALEANLALAFSIFAFYFSLKGLKSAKYFLPASLLWSLTLHTYNSYRIFTPLFLVAFLVIYFPNLKKLLSNKKHRTYLFASAAILLVAIFLVGYQVYSGSGTARYQKLAILTPDTVHQIGQARLTSRFPAVIARLLHNRPVFFVIQFLKNYSNYFFVRFLYQAQGAQSQFAIPIKNLLTLPTTLLFILGLSSLFYHLKNKSYRSLIAWLALAPIPAALTLDPPQALRPSVMIPAVVIFAALGLHRLICLFARSRTAQKAVLLISLFSVLLAFARYQYDYWFIYPASYSQSWQYGYQKAMQYVVDHQDEYDRIFISKAYGEPHIFYAFATALPPQDLQPGSDNIRFHQSDWFWTDKINNVYFVNDWDISHQTVVNELPLESGDIIPTEDALLVTTPDSLPSNTSLIQMTSFLDNSPAFIIAKF